MSVAEEYDKLVEQAKVDDNILGFFLAGSRGRGTQTDNSDWDCYMIVKDEAAEEYKNKYKELFKGLKVYSLTDFKDYGRIGSNTEWAGYGFSYLKVQVDKLDDGSGIQSLVDEKATLPSEVAEKLIDKAAGSYINSVYRSIKNIRDERQIASWLDAAESIPFFFTAMFALESRLRPYNKYLEWELQTKPLKYMDLTPGQLIQLIKQIGHAGNITAEQKLLLYFRKAYSNSGHSEIVEQWGDKLTFMLTFKNSASEPIDRL